MDRVLRELDKLRASPEKHVVHDLRVAIRRCRSVAAVMQEVDPDPTWHTMRRLPKKLFRKLGELRDTQIMDEWISDHGAENDKLRLLLHDHFQQHEPKLLQEALRLAEKFDEKEWARLQRKLSKRVRVVPTGSLAAQCLAVERLNEGKDLHTRAIRANKPASWHGLRIGIKKFRYTVESLLPQQYASWSPQLKQLQDLLGEVHDLDVLRVLLRQKAAAGASDLQAEWERTIDRQRAARLQEYRELTVGKSNVWQAWQQALPQRERLQLAAAARLRATARAGDSRLRRTAQISRFAVALFDALHRGHTAPAFDQPHKRRVLRAAARLSGLRVKRSDLAPQKAVREFLLDRPAPPSWSHQEWQLLAWTLRYQRGREPKTNGNPFSKLSEDLQTNVRALAGVLRLARGLRKCDVEDRHGLRVEKTGAAVLLHVPGLADTAANAARLASAKHLLDSYLGKPLILRPAAPASEKVVILPGPLTETPLAAASD
jgi:CHAD domain-containing protein